MPILFTDPANYDRFYLEYLEPSLMDYTGKLQDLVGPVSAFTIRNRNIRFMKPAHCYRCLWVMTDQCVKGIAAVWRLFFQFYPWWPFHFPAEQYKI